MRGQLFPEHCEENERAVDAEFAAADVNDSDGINFVEFLAYHARLKTLYDKADAAQDDVERRAAQKAAAHAALEAVPVPCSGCGKTFLADRIAAHERACEACKPVKAAAPPLAADSAATPAPLQKRRSVEFSQDNGPNNFVPCGLCGRRFFPDRLPVHYRVCAKKHDKGGLCRETVVDGATLSRGAYGAAGAAK